MFKEANRIFRKANIAADIIITGAAFAAAILITSHTNEDFSLTPRNLHVYTWLFYLSVFLWPVLLNINGLYPASRIRARKQTVWIILKTSLQGFLLVFAILFVFKLQLVSRICMATFILLVTLFLILKENAVVFGLRSLRKSGLNLRNVLIVGTIGNAKDMVERLEKNDFLGLRIAGLLVPANEVGNKEAWGQKILGSLGQIERVLHSYPIDNVLVTTYQENYLEIMNVLGHCEEEGKEVWLPTSIFNVTLARPDADELLEIPIFIFRTGPKFSWSLLIKIVLDRVSSLILAVLSLPIFLAAIILIKLTSPGPAIFKQKRCGVNGKTFTLYKLRTMYAGSEETLEELKKRNTMKGPLFKMDRDPRITPVGRFLRKTSIDEIPQFWNVLKGDMSLVGPRPPLPDEVNDYKGWHRRRLSMKPGITGLLQVSGRSDVIDFNRWVELDLEYIDNWSLWLDMKILFKTVFVVLSTRGAK